MKETRVLLEQGTDWQGSHLKGLPSTWLLFTCSKLTQPSCWHTILCLSTHSAPPTKSGDATSIIFVAINVLSWQNTSSVYHDKIFLSRQTHVCHNKIKLVMTKLYLSLQIFVTTKVLLRQIFVTTKVLLQQAYICCHKRRVLLRQKSICHNKHVRHDKTFVLAKMTLVAAPASDTFLFLTASVALLRLKLQHQILCPTKPRVFKVSILPQVSTNLKPPEGVAAVCVVTQKEASGLGGVVEQAFSGKALRLGDVSDLKQHKTNVNSISCCRVNSSGITSTHSFTQASQPFQTCCLILNPFSKQPKDRSSLWLLCPNTAADLQHCLLSWHISVTVCTKEIPTQSSRTELYTQSVFLRYAVSLNNSNSHWPSLIFTHLLLAGSTTGSQPNSLGLNHSRTAPWLTAPWLTRSLDGSLPISLSLPQPQPTHTHTHSLLLSTTLWWSGKVHRVTSLPGPCTHLIIFWGAWIERPAQEEFSNDTAQRPHVNSFWEMQAQQDLRGSATHRGGYM